jgi:hypothetical protein
MDQFNIDNISSLVQGIKVIEDNYINKVAAYLKTRADLGFNNVMFTKSYS